MGFKEENNQEQKPANLWDHVKDQVTDLAIFPSVATFGLLFSSHSFMTGYQKCCLIFSAFTIASALVTAADRSTIKEGLKSIASPQDPEKAALPQEKHAKETMWDKLEGQVDGMIAQGASMPVAGVFAGLLLQVAFATDLPLEVPAAVGFLACWLAKRTQNNWKNLECKMSKLPPPLPNPPDSPTNNGTTELSPIPT